MERSRFRLVASVVAVCCLAVACGSDGAAETADAAAGELVPSGPLTDHEIEAACRRAFLDFVAGAAPAFDRPYLDARFGLAMAGPDCFVTHHGDDGALLEVGDVSFVRGDGGVPVASVAWNLAGAIPDDVTGRLMRSIAVLQPGGGPDQLAALEQAAAADATAGAATGTSAPSGLGESMTGGGAAPTTTRAGGSVGGIGGGTAASGTSGSGGNVGGGAGSDDTRASTTAPGAPTTPSEPGSGGWWATTTPPPPPTNPPRPVFDAAQLADLQARCVYLGDGDACASLEANGYPASGNHGLGTSLTAASEAALVEDCVNAFRLACLELERRSPPAPGDGDVATTFVNGVLAGSIETIESVSSPGLVTHVPALGRGPFDDSPGSGVPGTSFGADGRLVFRTGPSSVVRCYVGSGSVRHCSVGAS